MAKVDYFLNINGVQGESIKDGHKNEIELSSWSWGEQNSGSAADNTGGGGGRCNMNDFTFSMTINKASPLIFQHCATGKHLDSATLTCREAGGKQQEYLKIKFTDVLISSYNTGGSEGDALKPIETITFNFARIDFTYAPQKKDGSLDSPITKWVNQKETTFG